MGITWAKQDSRGKKNITKVNVRSLFFSLLRCSTINIERSCCSDICPMYFELCFQPDRMSSFTKSVFTIGVLQSDTISCCAYSPLHRVLANPANVLEDVRHCTSRCFTMNIHSSMASSWLPNSPSTHDKTTMNLRVGDIGLHRDPIGVDHSDEMGPA